MRWSWSLPLMCVLTLYSDIESFNYNDWFVKWNICGKRRWRRCLCGGERKQGSMKKTRWIRRRRREVSRRRGLDEQEVNSAQGLEHNHWLFYLCLCFVALLELIALISALQPVIVQCSAYVRLLWRGCRAISGSTPPQCQPQSVRIRPREALVSNCCPLICIFIFGSNWQRACWVRDVSRAWLVKRKINDCLLCRPHVVAEHLDAATENYSLDNNIWHSIEWIIAGLVGGPMSAE